VFFCFEVFRRKTKVSVIFFSFSEKEKVMSDPSEPFEHLLGLDKKK